MKFVTALMFAFASHSAFADLTCDAHELMPGNSGRTGTIVMGQNPFSLKWNGDTTDLIGKGTLCGVALNATTVCDVKDHSRGPTVSVRMMCADTAKGRFEDNVGEAWFAFSEVNGVGRFGCSNISGPDRVEKIVELSNCK